MAAALRDGTVNLQQAREIVRALEAMPDDIAPEIRVQAEERLIEKATEFGPRGLRILGRRILDVVAPEVAEKHERQRLEKEEEDLPWKMEQCRSPSTPLLTICRSR